MNTRRVLIVGFDQAELLDIACVTSTLDHANLLSATPPYEVSMATPGGGAITCSSGLVLAAHVPLERTLGPFDTLVVSGGPGAEAAANSCLVVGHVRRLAAESRRVASVCTGACVLAATGLLDGRRATTHWDMATRLEDRYPQVTVDPKPIYINDGNVYTSAGITSALDLTLALVAEDHGTVLARKLARRLVTYLQRPGNQAQMSMFVAPAPRHELVRQVVDRVAGRLDGDLTTARLAMEAGVSERHLTRLFATHLGLTPGRYVRLARTEAAAHLLTSTRLPLHAVAKRCGFGSAETLRQAFVSRFGISPSRYKATQTSTTHPESGPLS